LSYCVEYKDIGRKDYKETWDLQADIFNKLVESKKETGREEEIRQNELPGTLIFVEHPHVYTLGKSGSEKNLLIDAFQLKSGDAAYYRIDRGGDITYHGPGQIVGYPIFDLEKIGIGMREYISGIEEAVIRTVDMFGLKAGRLEGATGVWLGAGSGNKPLKICAIGVKASRYVTMHGFAFNVNTDLSYFNFINPCGFTDKGVTSLQKETGEIHDMDYVKQLVRNNLREVFDLEWIKT